MLKDKKSLMWEIAGDTASVNGKVAFDAAFLGDKAALEVVNSFIEYLAIGISSVINLLQPDVVCIGGGISAQGDALLVPLNRKLEKLAFGTEDARTRVTVAKFRNDAGIIGAALLGTKREK